MQKKALIFWTVPCVIACLVYLFLFQGSGKTSPDGYASVQALYSACNLKDTARISKISNIIQQQHRTKKIRSDEFRWLTSVIQLAENRQWKKAQFESRKLMAKQVRIVK